MSRNKPRAFSLVELLVVIGIIGVLIAILLPTVSRGVRAARKYKCSNNLRQVGLAISMYAQEHRDLPRTMFTWNNAGPLNAFSCYMGDDPFIGNQPSSNQVVGSNNQRPLNMDVTAAIYLLLRQNYLKTSAVLVCPETDDTPDTYMDEGSPAKRSNFSSRENLSYSIALPYNRWDQGPNPPDDRQWGYYYGVEMKPDLPLMSDINPGTSGDAPGVSGLTLSSSEREVRQGNSPNHRKEGQNVLYFDGRVEWAKTPFCGLRQDNIFTRQANVNDASNPALQPPADQASDAAEPWGPWPPRGAHDSLMLPTATSTGHLAY